jgi:hypothetical protein
MAEAHLSPPAHHRDDSGVHHETTDVNIGGVLLFAASLFVVGVIVHLLVWVLFGYLSGRETRQGAREHPLTMTSETPLPPEPRLQINPREDLRELRAHEDEVLTSYGWVDKNAGIVRIPIEEAMKIVVQKGLPAREPTSDRR